MSVPDTAGRYYMLPMLDMWTDKMSADKFFAYGAELMKINPPHMTDNDMVARMRRLGIMVGESFDFAKAASQVQKAMQRAAADALKLMKEKQASLSPVINGWQVVVENMGVYGNSYLRRATCCAEGEIEPNG